MSKLTRLGEQMAESVIEQRKALLRSTNVRIGERLKNGATLLVETEPIPTETDSTTLVSVVLAVHTGFQPYVTWRRIRSREDLMDRGYRAWKAVDYCELGHYFRSLDEALLDFNDRR